MVGLDLSGCVHEKRIEMRKRQHFPTSTYSYILHSVLLPVFFKFSTPSQNVEFYIPQSHMEIWLSEEIKFCKRKMIKRTHFISSCKVINLF